MREIYRLYKHTMNDEPKVEGAEETAPEATPEKTDEQK